MQFLWLLPIGVAVAGSALLAATAAETARQAKETVAALRALTIELRAQMGQVRESADLARSRGEALCTGISNLRR